MMLTIMDTTELTEIRINPNSESSESCGSYTYLELR